MARAKKKTDEPQYRMIIENGRLVPAFPFDAEKLNTWRDGTRVLVTFSIEADRPLIRKWWAVIGTHMKGGNTPWEDKEAASASIKLALGMIDVAKLPEHGGWLQYGRSLTEYTDAELEKHVENMRALLYRITGIDDEAVYRESLGASHDDDSFVPDYPESSDNNPPAPLPGGSASDEGHGGPQASTPSTDGPAVADQSQAKATEDNVSTIALEGDAEPGVASRPDAGAETASSAGGMKSAASAKNKPRAKGDVNGADAAWLLELSRMLVAATEPKSGRQYVHLLAAAAQAAKDRYPPGGIGEKTKEVAKQIYNLCFDISIGTVPMSMTHIATLAGCRVADLKTPEPK